MILARGELRLFARRELFGRRDDDDVAFAALVETLGAQHDVESLVPGYVLQSQRHVALHGIAHHDVLAAGVRQQLQHRARLDVLEVERQTLAGVLLLVLERLPLSAPPA